MRRPLPRASTVWLGIIGGAAALDAWCDMGEPDSDTLSEFTRRVFRTHTTAGKTAFTFALAVGCVLAAQPHHQGDRMSNDDKAAIKGTVHAVLTGPDGKVKSECTVHNLVTAVGDQLYASRGAGLTSSAVPTGMHLGTGSTAVAKTGAGATIVTYLSGSNKAFDGSFPTAAAGVATYKRTYAAGEATTASAITEVVIVTATIATNSAAATADTVSRALLTGIGSKAAGDTLTITWTHTLLGA